MAVGLAVAGAAAVAALGAAAVKGGKKTAPAAVDTRPESEKPADGKAAPAIVPPVNVGTPPPLPPSGSGGAVASQVTGKVIDVAFGASAATVKAGFKVAELQRQVVTQIAGEGAGNTAAVFGPVATATFAVKTAAEKLGKELGVPADLNRRIAQTVGVAVGAPALLPFKVTGEAVSVAIRVVGGEKTERVVRDVFKGLDPTNHRNVTHAPVAAVASGVKAVAGFLGGVGDFFSGKKR